MTRVHAVPTHPSGPGRRLRPDRRPSRPGLGSGPGPGPGSGPRPLRRAGRRRPRRHAGGALLCLGTVLVALFLVAAPANAANAPTLITISGTLVKTPVTVHAETQADLFNEMLRQLSWMQTAAGTPMQIATNQLGPKYTVTISAAGDPEQVYDLYPVATGGPRAFRPAAQPLGKSSDAWFYASLSLPSLLRSAGVAAFGDASDFQEAGLSGDDAAPVAATSAIRVNLRAEVTQLKAALLSSAATVVLAMVVLAGAARFSRYRYRRRTSV